MEILKNGLIFSQRTKDVNFNRLLKKLNSNETQYFQFVSGARKGSIAKVSSYKDNSSNYYSYLELTLEWDNRKNKVETNHVYGNIAWLEDYEGPTEWCFTRNILTEEEKEALIKKPVPDALNREPKIGDLTAYCTHSYYGAEIRFGHIEKITKNGCIYCRSIKTSPTGVGGTLDKVRKSHKGTGLVIITSDFLNQLTIARLSN